MTEISAYEERVAKALEALEQDSTPKIDPAVERTRIAELEDENEIVRERLTRLRNGKVQLETKIDELTASLSASEEKSEGRHKDFLSLSDDFGALELEKQKTEAAKVKSESDADNRFNEFQNMRRKDMGEVDEILAKLTPLVEG